MLENYYITGLDIDLDQYNLGIIHQPTIKDLLENGMTNIDFIDPFFIVERMYIDILEGEKEREFSSFDLLYSIDFLIKEGEIFEKFKQSLSLIYQVNEDEILFMKASDITKTSIFVKSREVIINEDNYSILVSVLFDLFCIDRNDFLKKDDEDEKWIAKTGSKREKEMIEYFENKRKKTQEKKSLSLADYINVVCHIKNYTPYKEVLNLTFYQLMNSYKTLIQLDRYKEELGYRWSFKFSFKGEQKHWSEYVKVNKSTFDKNQTKKIKNWKMRG